MNQVRRAIGELPLVEEEMKRASGEKTDESFTTSNGNFATQGDFNSTVVRPPLIHYFMQGNFFIAAALGNALVKLSLRYGKIVSNIILKNQLSTETMLIMTSIIRLGRSGLPRRGITNDDTDRLYQCIRALSEPIPEIVKIFDEDCRNAFSKTRKNTFNVVQVDDPISFMQLPSERGDAATENIYDRSLKQALVGGPKEGATMVHKSRVTQLTGFFDPVYAEAQILISYPATITLDVLIVNRTSDILENCTLDLGAFLDLKILEEPQSIVLGPHDICNLEAKATVSSTETNCFYGFLVYDKRGEKFENWISTLVDITPFIVRGVCNETDFIEKWKTFSGKYQILVESNFTDLNVYFNNFIKKANMTCVTLAEWGFLCANIYATSTFGEEYLANLSVETQISKPEVPVTGRIHIRAQNQMKAIRFAGYLKTITIALKTTEPR